MINSLNGLNKNKCNFLVILVIRLFLLKVREIAVCVISNLDSGPGK